MKRLIIVSSLVGWLVIFCITSGVFESLAMFLLFGILPWSNITLSAQYMLTFSCFAALTVLVLTFRKQLDSFLVSLQTTRRRSQA